MRGRCSLSTSAWPWAAQQRRRGTLVTSVEQTEHPDLAPLRAVRGEGLTLCHQWESPRDDRGVEVVRDLWRSAGPSPLLEQGHLELLAQDHA